MSEPVPQPGLFATEAFPTEVLLIRHGRSADVIPGAPDSFDPPLHEVGVLQATALAERLDGKHLDAVYSSDLARAVADGEAAGGLTGASRRDPHRSARGPPR